MKAARLAEQTGCLVAEAAGVLAAEQNESRALAAILAMMNQRRRIYQSSILDVWSEFAGHRDTQELDISGTIKFVQALGLDLEDPIVLAVAYELQAPRVGTFLRTPFIDGWARLEAGTLDQMRKRVPSLRSNFEKSDRYFRDVYRFTFAFNLPEGTRLLAKDTAVAYWKLLLIPRFAIAQRWLDFLDETGNNHNVSVDTWNMTLELCEYVANEDPGLTNYDETSAWPAIMDNFVEWYKSKT